MIQSSNPHKRTRSIRQGTRSTGPGCLELALFADLADPELAALSAAFVTRHFADGEVLISQGERGDEMYLLEEGQVRIEVAEASRPDFIRLVQSPAALGEMALLTDDVRTATVRAVGAVKCARLDRARFEALVAQRPEVGKVLTRLLGERLKEIDGIRRVGKYTVTGVLGAGAVARVFSAVHPDLGLPVALKMLTHAVVHHPQFADAFDEEARLIARLSHPNVVRVYDTAEAYGTRFIVMELLEGRMLEERIVSREPLDWSVINRILIEMTEALAHVHQHGLVHRDVKPDNIFLADSGAAKLLDFGIAIREARSICPGDTRLGTPFYMAPEQILGWQLDGRTDLYALGMTAYEMAARRVAYDAVDLRSLLQMHIDSPPPELHEAVPAAPIWLAEFVRRCTQKHPDDRFGSATEASRFLREAPAAETGGRTLCFASEHALAVDMALRTLQSALADAGIDLTIG